MSMKTWLKWFLSFSLLAAVALLLIPQGYFRDQGVDRAAWCEDNLRLLNRAIEQWAVDKQVSRGSPIAPDELRRYLVQGMPHCPAGGNYTVNAGESPVCSLPKELHRIVH